ncbi:MAG: polyketide synthase dehydratase domain-containing protein, partial [Rivularia sp. ALOHA_DT_140]|nr:polyketide synthase dehydratase domain-containing protein [Rivularia sp. ALOHA_DT_140]
KRKIMRNDCQHHETQMGIRLESWELDPKWVLYITSPQQSENTTERPLHLLTLSAKTEQGLSELVKNYQEYLTNNDDVEFADICFSGNIGRSHFQHRLSIVVKSTQDAIEKLTHKTDETLCITSLHKDSVFIGTISNKRPKIAFLFSGENHQYINMGWELYQTQPTFKQALDKCNEILKSLINLDLLTFIYPSSASSASSAPSAHISTFAIQYALHKLWTSWGINPDILIADGIGEYVAATVSGVFSLEDGLKLLVSSDKNEFEKIANSINYSFPKIKIFSQITGKLINSEIATSSYWCERISQTVSLDKIKIIDNLKEIDCDICLELGVKSTLSKDSSTEILFLSSLSEGDNKQDWQIMLSSLAQMYVNGVNINWRGFEQDYLRNRVVLPTYPFQRQRYWIEAANHHQLSKINIGNIHPLLGQRIDIANLATIHFENQINQENPVYLQHHQVFDTVIMPFSGYVEMVLAAASNLYGNQINKLLLTDVEIHQALILEKSSTTVQLILTPIFTSNNQEYKFEIFSLKVGWVERSETQQSNNSQIQTQNWILHASGKVSPTNADLAKFDLSRTQTECNQLIEIENFYQSSKEQGINYGKSFQAINQLWNHEQVALAEIVLPQEFINSTAYKLHPILLDASLQVVGSVLPDNQTYLPIGINNFTFSETTSNVLWSYVELDENDNNKKNNNNSSLITAYVQLVEPDGRLVAEIKGLQLKLVDSEFVFNRINQKQSFSDWLYQIEWREQDIIK